MKNNTIKIPAIVEYWSAIKYEGDMGVDWVDADKRCWRCGYKSRLEKCHIIPRALGGENLPHNLVLLCSLCHKEAPNINNKDCIWNWIQSTKSPFYDTFWSQRAWDEYQKLFNSSPIENMTTKQINMFRQRYKNALNTVVVHWGQSRFNATSLVYMMKDLADSIKNGLEATVDDCSSVTLETPEV